ncbi:hypothetical protein Nepgr_025337 [Nepenthes gracilis]|uniref:Uncharacterized protein n=1 Tax=Nepenthes gracilis TaxID=150966 RepID=A0AAD3T6N9_NEPGR|nr:hypothetical protein Nepgr_025337 [Nepenthes gracilis]
MAGFNCHRALLPVSSLGVMSDWTMLMWPIVLIGLVPFCWSNSVLAGLACLADSVLLTWAAVLAGFVSHSWPIFCRGSLSIKKKILWGCCVSFMADFNCHRALLPVSSLGVMADWTMLTWPIVLTGLIPFCWSYSVLTGLACLADLVLLT